MRKIEIRTIDEDILLVYIDDEYTGFNYMKRDMNAMLDDLEATSEGLIGRKSLMAELVARSLARCYPDHPLKDGPLTPEELSEAARQVGKSIKRGWFS